jgi:hypothetical protein
MNEYSFLEIVIDIFTEHSITAGHRANWPFNCILYLATLFSKMKKSKYLPVDIKKNIQYTKL